MKTLPELLLDVLVRLWWIPLPFLVGKVAVSVCKRIGKLRKY